MRITYEQKQELISEWNSIGMNDCSAPRREIDELFRKIMDAITDKKEINCACVEENLYVHGKNEPNPKCKVCKGSGKDYLF